MTIYHLQGFDGSSDSTGTATNSIVEPWIQRRYSRQPSGIGQPFAMSGWHSGKSYVYSPNSNAINDELGIHYPAQAEIYFGYAVKPSSFVDIVLPFWATRETTGFEGNPGGYRQVECYLFHGGTLAFTLNGTPAWNRTLGVFPNILRGNRWAYLEFYVKIHASAGIITCWKNGYQVGTLTSLVTLNTVPNIDYLELRAQRSYNGTAREKYMAYDDIYVATERLTPVKIEQIHPDGEGDTINFNPSAGADNSLMVNENENDGDATYNQSANTSGNKDLLTCGNLVDVDTAIKAVQVDINVRTTSVGGIGIKAKVKSGTTEGTGTEQGVGADEDNYLPTQHIFETNPDTTSAWTPSEVNGMQIGYEVG